MAGAKLHTDEVEEVGGSGQPGHGLAVEQVAGNGLDPARLQPLAGGGIAEAAHGDDAEIVLRRGGGAAGQHGQRWSHLAARAENQQRAPYLADELHQSRARTAQDVVKLRLFRYDLWQ